MRFERLDFSAFGPFTGLSLDLSGGAPGGFHIVFGPNEAGKSSALRGVHDLLFGFPERTPDAHVHPNAELRDGPDAIDLESPEALRRLLSEVEQTLVPAVRGSEELGS